VRLLLTVLDREEQQLVAGPHEDVPFAQPIALDAQVGEARREVLDRRLLGR
jgi:hypothetical protein